MDVAVLRPLFILFPHHYPEIASRADLWNRDVWGWVEPADVAAAVRLALEKISGFEIFFIGAPNTLAPEPTLDLVARRFGKSLEVRRPELYRQDPNAALFDIAKARRLLGYHPSGDWRRHLPAAALAAGPSPKISSRPGCRPSQRPPPLPAPLPPPAHTYLSSR